MEAVIKERLGDLAAKHRVRIVHACESGSRAWGFASADSDYDVRFVYVHPVEWYLTVGTPRDTIDVLDGDFDAGGWDLRKALGLMRKGNVPLLEWLGSPIAYQQDEPAFAALQTLATRAFLPESAAHHYLAMARNKREQLLSGENRSLKAAFYGLRAALCARFIADDLVMAPVPFAPLAERYLDKDDTARVDDWLATKLAGLEADCFADFEQFAALIGEHMAMASTNVPKNPEKLPVEEFDQVFRALVHADDPIAAKAAPTGTSATTAQAASTGTSR